MKEINIGGKRSSIFKCIALSNNSSEAERKMLFRAWTFIESLGYCCNTQLKKSDCTCQICYEIKS